MSGGQTSPEELTRQVALCSTEPIHVPGAIQPHGVLCVLDEPSLTIAQHSANLAGMTGAHVDAPPGTRVVREIFGEALHRALDDVVTHETLSHPHLLGSFDVGDRCYDALVHRYQGRLVLELEPTERTTGEGFAAVQAIVRSLASNAQRGRSLDALYDFAVREMHRITGFGRTLLYRFDEEGHGEVLAECLSGAYDSYLGHRFPASDIPSQARALYLRNTIRLIPDSDYVPSPIVPARHPATGQPTDLTHAALRSVSPVHLEYMRNMGTRASMSVSLVVQGKLWGLISCHHETVRRLPYSLRLAAEHLGQIVSLQIEAREGVDDARHGIDLRRELVSLVSVAAESGGSLEALADAGAELMHFADAAGSAVVSSGRVRLVGTTPRMDEVTELVEWLATQGREVFATDRLGELFAPARAYADTASGMLALSVSQMHRHYVIWFRPEVVRTVTWAGNPSKPRVDDTSDDSMRGGTAQLHPRRSFSSWREEVRGRSLPWRTSEETVAAEFRHALLNLVLRRAEEVASLAGELGRINKELEAFSYSVSHDLRAPLRHITGYADLVREYEGNALTERGQRFIQNIKDSAKFAGTLVDDLLGFSQMGRSALRPTRVSLTDLVASIIRHRQLDPAAGRIEWKVGALPTVMADAVFMQVVMQNLIDNAVKYSATREHPVITISGESTETQHVVRVADNGVGFDMRYVNKLFGVFQRLHAMEEFGGTGIGLASVRRAVERHGGQVQAEGAIDQGATFTIMLPTAAPATAPAARAIPSEE